MSGLHLMDKLSISDRAVTSFAKITCLMCYSLLFILLLGVVCMRVFELGSMYWIDDIRDLLIVWMIFLGAFVVFEKNQHVRMNMFQDYMQKRFPFLGKIWCTVNNTLVLLFLLIFLKGIWNDMLNVRANVLPGIEISKLWWLTPMFISTLLMTLVALRRWLFSIRAILITDTVIAAKNT